MQDRSRKECPPAPSSEHCPRWDGGPSERLRQGQAIEGVTTQQCHGDGGHSTAPSFTCRPQGVACRRPAGKLSSMIGMVRSLQSARFGVESDPAFWWFGRWQEQRANSLIPWPRWSGSFRARAWGWLAIARRRLMRLAREGDGRRGQVWREGGCRGAVCPPGKSR